MENPILRLRLQVNMSQQEFAAALGISRATIQAAETGANHRPGRALLDALERAGYDVADIQQQFNGWKQEEQKRAQARLTAALRAERAGA